MKQAPGSGRRRATRTAIAVIVMALLLALATTVWVARNVTATEARGARLFDGREPLTATLSGHATPLPARTARCSQCHAGPVTPLAANGWPALPGPPLDSQHLRAALSRRGGPPVAYDLSTFCRTLREGIDPAHVMLPRTMPRFDIDDTRCEALWTHLTGNTS
ncbi:hypothetical protein ACSFA2_10910 [Variovorax sp. LT2P21]|uniref:hypothetical protein n=1 Tax=Variovorax sp. LT2P21 TaxID=3443731 RepID=UPI003F47344E